jgi:hypothetical protein
MVAAARQCLWLRHEEKAFAAICGQAALHPPYTTVKQTAICIIRVFLQILCARGEKHERGRKETTVLGGQRSKAADHSIGPHGKPLPARAIVNILLRPGKFARFFLLFSFSVLQYLVTK